MAASDEHIKQALRNLELLELVNAQGYDFYDWQVTVCFYVGVHLVNAHLSHFNLHYHKHVQVDEALNPEKSSGTSISKDAYVNYTTLSILSRRARYLVNENQVGYQEGQAHLTHEKHLKRALHHLDELLHYFEGMYRISTNCKTLHCGAISPQQQFHFLKVTNKSLH